MSYYDFEHFWEPDRVCGHKTTPESTPDDLSSLVKSSLVDVWHQILDRLNLGTQKKSYPESAEQIKSP